MSFLPPELGRACEKVIGAPIRRVSPVNGGDINIARKLDTGAGVFFVKFNTHSFGREMLRTEALGLGLLGAGKSIYVPEVLNYDTAGGAHFLLLEFIRSGRSSTAFWENFGTALAGLHRQPQPFFGLSFDNYIGSLPQANGQYDSFPLFFIEGRLEPQISKALDDGLLDHSDRKAMDRLYRELGSILPEESPALIHGDLWSGNFLIGQGDRPVLIDPAVAFSHREMDLAMSRLFGGFDPVFYQAYQQAYPTAPGLDLRIPIYQLYYLLVHVNLFGKSYSQAVRRILQPFL